MTAGKADFQRTLNVTGIVAVNTGSSVRVHLAQTGVELVERESFQFSTQRGSCWGEVVRAVSQELEIQTGAPHDDRQFSPSTNVLEDRECHLSVLPSVKGVAWIRYPVKVVGDQVAVFLAGRGCDGLDTSIELESISINDFSVKRVGKTEGVGRLPRGGRTTKVKRLRRFFGVLFGPFARRR